MVHTGTGWKSLEDNKSLPESPTDSYFGPLVRRCCLTPHILPSSAGEMWGARAERGAVFLAPHTWAHHTEPFPRRLLLRPTLGHPVINTVGFFRPECRFFYLSPWLTSARRGHGFHSGSWSEMRSLCFPDLGHEQMGETCHPRLYPGCG